MQVKCHLCLKPYFPKVYSWDCPQLDQNFKFNCITFLGYFGEKLNKTDIRYTFYNKSNHKSLTKEFSTVL